MPKLSNYEKIAARQKRAAKKFLEELKAPQGSINDTIPAIIGNNMEFWKVKKNEDSYGDNYVVYRGINLLADNIAQLKLNIYRGDDLMEPSFELPNGNHKPFNIQYPADDLTLYELLYETAIYFFYRGEWMNYINLFEGSKNVFEIVPANPKFMQINNKDKATGRILDWLFDRRINIPTEQLIYAKFINPDGDRGISPVKVVVDEILTDREAIEFNKSYFSNYGKTGGMLIDEKGEITADQMRNLVSDFNNAHLGSGNAHKILGLPGGIKYQEAMQSMKELEFLESRRDVRDRILLVLGIHKALVGVTDSVDRAVAETAMRALWRLTLRPAAIRIQNKLNLHLFKRYFPGFTCKFDFSEIEELKTSRKDIIEEAKGLRELGYTLNEIEDRLNLGMGQIEDARGDTALIPQLLIPFSDYIGSSTTPPVKSIEELVSKILSDEQKGVALETSHNKSIRRDWIKLQRKTEPRFMGKMRNFFSKELVRVLASVNNAKQAEWNPIVILANIKRITSEDKELLLSILMPLYEETSKEAIAIAQSAINVPADGRISKEVIDKLSNRIVGVTDHTYNLIRNEVMSSYQSGETIAQLSKRIQQVGKFNNSRARLIARTESNTIISASTHEEYVKNGVEKKRWLTAGDSDVRDTHLQNEQDGAIGMNESFSGTGEQYPQSPNCRCTIAPVVER
jgi:HK97 family phage portal protein